MNATEWKPVDGFANYEVSNYGDVRHGARLLKIRLDRKGYHKVSLWRDDKPHTRLVAPLVAHAFIGPKPAGTVTRHRDGVKAHNSVDNLHYGTPSENELDKRAHGTAPVGERHPAAKLTEADVRAIRARFRRHSHSDGTRAIARDYGVTGPLISAVVNRKIWKDVLP